MVTSTSPKTPVTTPKPRKPSIDKQAQIDQDARPDVVLTKLIPMLLGGNRMFPFPFLTGVSKDINWDELGYDIYARMRQYPTIKFGMNLIKMPILSRVARGSVDCDDPSIKRAVEYAFFESGTLYELSKHMLRSLDFGVSFNEKIWHVDQVDLNYDFVDENGIETEESAWKGPLLVIKEFLEVNPIAVMEICRRIEPSIKGPADGSFDGFMFNGGQGTVEIPAAKSFVYTNMQEFGNLWGVPETKAAFPFYQWAQVINKLAMAWAERKVAPTRLARFPQGVDKDTHTDNQQTAIFIGNAMDNVGTVALPSDRDRTGNYAWDLTEYQISDKTTIFDNLMKILDRMMLWSIGVPERIFMEAQFGSRAEAAAHSDMFLLTVDSRITDISEAVNKYAVEPFVTVNFGTDAPKAKIVIPGVTDEQRTILRNILIQLLANPDVQSKIDFGALATMFGVPMGDFESLDESTGKQTPLVPGEGQQATQPPFGQGGEQSGQGGQPREQRGGTAAGGAGFGRPSLVPPPNAILSDEDDVSVSLASGFDSNRWSVTEDPSAISGFKVVDNNTGKRLTGFAANKVIESYQKDSTTKASKAAQEQAKSARDAARQERQATATNNKAQRDTIREQKKQERDAAKVVRDQKSSDRKAQVEANKQQRATTAAEHQQLREQQQATRQQQIQTQALVSTVKADRTRMEMITKKEFGAKALPMIQAQGYTSIGQAADRNAAITTLTTAADKEPDKIFTMVQVKDGFLMVSKPKADITVAAVAPNVAASDVQLDVEDDTISTTVPGEEVFTLWQHAEQLLREIGMFEQESEIDDVVDLPVHPLVSDSGVSDGGNNTIEDDSGNTS